ncbi:hypothetical protein KSS87_011794 [Heliosperma pusillum]|nr:hypothetical protein KSS87_011794 [Heliosperma pusillum]
MNTSLLLRRCFCCLSTPSSSSPSSSASSLKKKPLVFLGSPQVAAIVTHPPGQRNRGRKLMPSPVAQYAMDRGFSPDVILTPRRASEESFLASLQALEPELCVTAAYGNILPTKFLKIPTQGTVNIHPSLLPLYRGAAPVQRALQDGVKETGVSLAFTVKALDSGPVIASEKIAVDENIKVNLDNSVTRLPSTSLSNLTPTLHIYTQPRTTLKWPQPYFPASLTSVDHQPARPTQRLQPSRPHPVKLLPQPPISIPTPSKLFTTFRLSPIPPKPPQSPCASPSDFKKRPYPGVLRRLGDETPFSGGVRLVGWIGGGGCTGELSLLWMKCVYRWWAGRSLEGSGLLVHELPSILDGTASNKAQPQNDSNATLAPKVRAFSGWPGTRAMVQAVDTANVVQKILDLKIITTRVSHAAINRTAEDDVVSFSNGALIFPCAKETALEVLEVQLPGKKVVDATSFWNGLQGLKVKRFMDTGAAMR